MAKKKAPLKTIVFTGVSGGGKTTALRAVEDLGYHCVDNLPLPLLQDFIKTMEKEPSVNRTALVIDARLKQYIGGYAQAISELEDQGHLLEVFYLDAHDDVLIQRFSQSRRRHPLSEVDVRAGLVAERRLLAPLRAHAVGCLDTSKMTVHQLKAYIQERYQVSTRKMVASVLSFGFKYGVPVEADFIVDVRFISNPYFVSDLRPLTGHDEKVASYVMAQEDTSDFIKRTEDYLRWLIPRYEKEGKAYFTVGIGCTGGRHRSVAIANEISRRLSDICATHVRHRDVEK